MSRTILGPVVVGLRKQLSQPESQWSANGHGNLKPGRQASSNPLEDPNRNRKSQKATPLFLGAGHFSSSQKHWRSWVSGLQTLSELDHWLSCFSRLQVTLYGSTSWPSVSCQLMPTINLLLYVCRCPIGSVSLENHNSVTDSWVFQSGLEF